MKLITILKIMPMLIGICGLSACISSTPIATTVGTINVSRTLSERMTDFGIERQIMANLPNIAELGDGNHRIFAKSYQGAVLLTGEVPTASSKLAVQRMAASIREVRYLYNYLNVVGDPKSQSHTVHENYLQAKANARLLAKSAQVKSAQYDITVRNDIAYVMGVFTPYQQDIIYEQLRKVDGLVGVSFLNTLITVADTSLANAPLVDAQVSNVNAPINSTQISGVAVNNPQVPVYQPAVAVTSPVLTQPAMIAPAMIAPAIPIQPAIIAQPVAVAPSVSSQPVAVAPVIPAQSAVVAPPIINHAYQYFDNGVNTPSYAPMNQQGNQYLPATSNMSHNPVVNLPQNPIVGTTNSGYIKLYQGTAKP